MQGIDFRVIQKSEMEEVLEFETKKLVESYPDETERTFQMWQSRSRKEALEHYVPMGWSFLARERDADNTIRGYFLAQPLLFFQGLTQSLWIEHMQFQSLEVRDALIELAYRLSREKHFQGVYYPHLQSVQNAIQKMRAEVWNPNASFVKTVR